MSTDYEIVKKDVYAIVMTSNDFISKEELNSTYELLLNIGPIPYKSLGYRTLEELICSFKDVLEIKVQRNIFFCKAKITEDCAQLAELKTHNKYSKGKINNKNYSFKTYSYSKKYENNFPVVEPNYPVKNLSDKFVHSIASKNAMIENNILSCGKPIQSNNKNKLKIQLQDLMLSYPSGLHIDDFREAYLKRFGTLLDFKSMHFENILEMFSSFNDILNIVKEGSNMIIYENGKRFAKRIKPGVIEIKNNLKKKDFEISGSFNEDLDTNGISIHLKMVIEKILKLNQSGIHSKRFISAFEKTVKKPLPLKELGFKTVNDLMGFLEEIHIDKVADGFIFKHKDNLSIKEDINKNFTGIKNINDESQSIDTQNRFKILSNRSKSCLSPRSKALKEQEYFEELILVTKEIINSTSDGVLKSEFYKKYMEVTNKPLLPENLGLKSIDQVISKLLKEVLISQYLGNGKVLLKLKENKESNILSGCVNFNENFKFNELTTSRLGSKYDDDEFVIMITEFISPAFFWFQLHAFLDQLIKLMNQLQEFYNNEKNNAYHVPVLQLKVGLPCVAIYPDNGDWHRCIIRKLDTKSSTAELFYVDYGSTCNVPTKDLRLLKRDFFLLNAQAMQGKLADIKPINEKWSDDAWLFMFNSVIEVELTSQLQSIDERGIASLCLNLMFNESFVCFNELMVLKKFALSDIYPKQNFGVDEINDLHNSGVINNIEYSDVNCCKPLVLPPQNIFMHIPLINASYIHLFNFNNKPYVESCEISAFFFSNDILESQLLIHSSRWKYCSQLEIYLDDDPKLFYKICGIIPKLSNNKELIEKDGILIFYELSVFSEILETFDHPSESLKLSIQSLLDLFNPNDFYWTGEEDMDVLNDELESADDYNDYQQSEISHIQDKIAFLHKDRTVWLKKLIDSGQSKAKPLVQKLKEIDDECALLLKHIDLIKSK